MLSTEDNAENKVDLHLAYILSTEDRNINK